MTHREDLPYVVLRAREFRRSCGLPASVTESETVVSVVRVLVASKGGELRRGRPGDELRIATVGLVSGGNDCPMRGRHAEVQR